MFLRVEPGPTKFDIKKNKNNLEQCKMHLRTSNANNRIQLQKHQYSDAQILKLHICDVCVIIDHKALDARFTLLPHLSYETYHCLTHFLLPTEYLTHRPPILALAGIQDLLPYHRT